MNLGILLTYLKKSFKKFLTRCTSAEVSTRLMYLTCLFERSLITLDVSGMTVSVIGTDLLFKNDRTSNSVTPETIDDFLSKQDSLKWAERRVQWRWIFEVVTVAANESHTFCPCRWISRELVDSNSRRFVWIFEALLVRRSSHAMTTSPFHRLLSIRTLSHFALQFLSPKLRQSYSQN